MGKMTLPLCLSVFECRCACVSSRVSLSRERVTPAKSVVLPPGDIASSVSLFFLSAAISSLFSSMCSARPALTTVALQGNPEYNKKCYDVEVENKYVYSPLRFPILLLVLLLHLLLARCERQGESRSGITALSATARTFAVQLTRNLSRHCGKEMEKDTPESPLKVVGADHPAGAAPMVSTNGSLAPVIANDGPRAQQIGGKANVATNVMLL